MAAVINTGLLTKGLRSEFFEKLNAMPTHFAELAMRIPSNAASENYKWLGSVPNMREMGARRLAKGIRTESYSVENAEYESTIEVARSELEDDQTGQISIRVRELAERAATHKDYLLAQLLINGGNAGYLSYDGLTFFNDAHVSGDSGNQDNDLAYNAADHTNVTSAEFKAALSQAIQTMLAFKDDQGEPMSFESGGLVAVVPPQLTYAAMEAVNASLINNTDNVLRGAARVLTFPWLTSGAVWYLLKTNRTLRPFFFQDRLPIEFTAVDQADSDTVFNRSKMQYGTRARYRMTYGMWQYAVRMTFN